MTKSIYDLGLHESISVESTGEDATTYWQVMRVADGWIYTMWDDTKQDYGDGVVHVIDNRVCEGII